MYENRKYAIILTSQIDTINFDEVLETGPHTCRYSVDGTKTFVKYEGTKPVSVPDVTEYTHDQILEILSTEEWTSHISD